MSQTGAGSGGGADQNGQTPGNGGGGASGDGGDGGSQDAGSGKKGIAVLIAVIGAAAVVVAAAIQVLPDMIGGSGESSGKDPEATVSATPSSDPCDLDRLEGGEDAWARPAAQRPHPKLLADRKPSVLTRVDGDANPGISVRGRLQVSVPDGQVLYLVRQPDRNTRDEEGRPGSHQYYPAALVTPDADGCWGDTKRQVGYDGARGITEIYYVCLVSREQADRFARDRAADGWDGYGAHQWGSVGAIDVLSFRVPTVT
ncbi:hypothetical protein PV755_19160 [Streptomyces caniscabiei]|uniref:Uncharacterized protein n=1 Tax=Streptomyces caniscabiei TaxID=2746961 RepID=A0A927L037_9ACTN|nr:hypothetical protein [Streptomyces caniscabiei]MBD9723560.1 hypothetical protein [Streptomyces caniscabiei]MDX3511044.1 hypothetical protein [Streptomyces caniscabiei]MDX3721124.1 hypothetical protein [Streptomyces caniscabiei]WEO27130.1 hypothetical protein IHE65_30395 [Streptomyces caniscabiei]